MVAPCAGAWIETFTGWSGNSGGTVAPCAGAWIETSCPLYSTSFLTSPPARGRGLKHRWAQEANGAL